MLDRVLEKERDNYAPAPSLYRHTRQDLSWDRNDTLIRSLFCFGPGGRQGESSLFFGDTLWPEHDVRSFEQRRMSGGPEVSLPSHSYSPLPLLQ